MLGQLPLVNRVGNLQADPTPGSHFDSAFQNIAVIVIGPAA